MRPRWRRFLAARGHEVEVVTTAVAAPPASRELPGALHLALGSRSGSGISTRPRLITRRARRADVVYSTGMFGRTGIGVARSRDGRSCSSSPATRPSSALRARGRRARRRRRVPGGGAAVCSARAAAPGSATAIVRRASHVVHAESATSASSSSRLGRRSRSRQRDAEPAPPDARAFGLASRAPRRGSAWTGATLVFAGPADAPRSRSPSLLEAVSRVAASRL